MKPLAVFGRIIVIAMVWSLACHTAMANPVEVNRLTLRAQSSFTGVDASLAAYGNRIGTFDHETSLKRVPADMPFWPAPHGGLLQMYSSLDVNVEAWFIADKGDRIPGGNGLQIPYAHEGNASPAPAIIPSEIFYVAFVWDYNFVTPSGNEVFGWAKLQALPPATGSPPGTVNPDLVLLASATTTDDRGIIVGEYRVVPEPSSFFTMALGAGLLLSGMRRARP